MLIEDVEDTYERGKASSSLDVLMLSMNIGLVLKIVLGVLELFF